MDHFLDFFRGVNEFLSSKRIHIGDQAFTLAGVLYVLIAIVALYNLSRILRRWLVHRALARGGSDIGTREAIGTIFHYIIVSVGTMVIITAAGVNLSTLAIALGTLGVGIGFGLQTITNNFVSGLIILLERPVKVGDRIEVGNIVGDISSISPRATTVTTNDNISVIIPNSEFISSQVINWSHSGQLIRISMDIGVTYNVDPEVVRRLFIEAAHAHPGVLHDPGPDVIFKGYGESSLDFSLRVWTRDFITRPNVLRSDLYFDIFKRLKEQHIEIPFPQRDLHIRSGVLDVRRVDPPETPRARPDSN